VHFGLKYIIILSKNQVNKKEVLNFLFI